MVKYFKQVELEKLAEDQASDAVVVRITKMGDGKVSTGNHHPNLGDELYEAGDEVTVPRSVGQDLEDRGYAEITAKKPQVAGGDERKAVSAANLAAAQAEDARVAREKTQPATPASATVAPPAGPITEAKK